MPIFAPLARLVVAGSLVTALAACDGVGKGQLPVSIEIIRGSSLVDQTNNVAYQCFRDSLAAVVTWSNGTRANYTSSTGLRWDSSDENIVKVSNGDIQLPDDEELAYPAGTILPNATGTATIIATFLDTLVATYEVQVKTVDALTIEPVSQTLALNTAGSVKLTTTVDGEEIDVTQRVLWKFQEADTEDLAVIGVQTGVVAALKEPGVVTAVPRFVEGCSMGEPTATINIRPLESIAIERQFASAPNNELMLNTSDRFSATGHFAGTAETQDLSAQIAFKSSDTEVVFAATRLVSGIKVGTANVTGVYTLKINDDEDDNVVVTSNAVPLTIIDRPLDSIAVTPATATIEAGETQQYNAVGSFTDGVVTTTQDITRHVVWGVSDTALATIGNGVQLDYGVAAALKNEATTAPIEITAKRTIGSGDTAVEKKGTAQLNITAIPETP
jgi:hypothetical protein